MYHSKPKRLVATVLGGVAMLAVGAANAATLQLDFSISFGDPMDPDTAPPAGPAPYLTALFDDGGSAGSVTLTLTMAGTVGGADVTGVYLNVDDAIGAENLNINYSSGQVDNGISAATDSFKPDSDGLHDILISYANNAFMAGESSVFTIDDGGLNTLLAASFNFASTPDPGEMNPTGPWRGAAKFQSTGNGLQSDWIGVAVPVPAAVWLFGSALGLLGWIRRSRG